MKYLFFLFFLLSATGLSAQVPEENTGDYSRQPSLLNNFRAFRQQEGWTTIEGFKRRGHGYVLYLRAQGFDASGYNARIRPIRTDGSIGAPVKSYKWTQGWTSAIFYPSGDDRYLILVKAKGISAAGKNVHVHRLNEDGSVGRLMQSYKWSEGWTNFSYYSTGGKQYLLQAKETGYGDSGNNVHVREIGRNGVIGKPVASYRWTEGWDSFETCHPSNGLNTTILIQAKSRGYGNSGNNVHIRNINRDGRIGSTIASYRWSEGWTSFTAFMKGIDWYVLQLKENPTGPNAAAKVRRVESDGTLSPQIESFNIPAGWTSVSNLLVYQKGFLIWSRSRGYDPGSNQNVRVYTVR